MPLPSSVQFLGFHREEQRGEPLQGSDRNCQVLRIQQTCPVVSASIDFRALISLAPIMDPQQWQQQQQSYSDSAGGSRRHNGSSQMPRDYADQPPQAPPSAYKYDQYHANSVGSNAPTSSMANSQLRDGNGDVPMHDALDAHMGTKSYPMRPHHHHQAHLSGGRPGSLQSPHDQQPSSAAQRYSPMETLSPTSPYAKTGQFGNMPQRQSPTRQGDYSQSSYFSTSSRSSTQQQLPSLVSSFDNYPSQSVANLDGVAAANHPRSPLHRPNPAPPRVVPQFKKVRTLSDLHPKKTRQPPFRRANPEGGFISVSGELMSSYLCTCLLMNHVLRGAALAGIDMSSAGNVPYLQPKLQIRDVQKSTSSPDEAKQRSQERWL